MASIFLYGGVIALIRKGFTLTARISLVFILLSHMTYITYLFSPRSGFQLYYFIIPTIIGIAIDVSLRVQRIWAILFLVLTISFYLLFSHAAPPSQIVLDATWYQLLNFSSSLISMLFLFIGFSYFAGEIRRSKDRLVKVATTDSLTAILNRREFMERSRGELEAWKRYKHPLSLILCDLDFFKQINDTYGHAVGDQVLTAFVTVCETQLRNTDLFGRLGGEEFGILLPGTDSNGAKTLAERIRITVAEMAIPLKEGETHITVSIGVSSCGDGIETVDQLILEADQALYLAKENGRNCVATKPW